MESTDCFHEGVFFKNDLTIVSQPWLIDPLIVVGLFQSGDRERNDNGITQV